MNHTRRVFSVVIPAHNEAAVIGRLLSRLLADAEPGELEIVVVANGCTDTTVEVAQAFRGPVRVVTAPSAGKYAALRLGDEHVTSFPRLYVDADVELGIADVRALVAALSRPGVLAVAPERDLPLADRPWIVRWYYDVWQRLPAVRSNLFGRGVIGVSATGHPRLRATPDVMGDDLAAAVAFTPDERRVIGEATVRVHPPRTTADLIRRRVRSLTATAEMRVRDQAALAGARTSRSDLVALLRSNPLLAPKVGAFIGVTLWARWRARKPIRSGDYTTWLRDESSRT
jgi:glycosyltransferase involved in cell wall biosynthesis